MKVGFIGLGKLGLPCALAINNKGHQVWGYDINPKVKEILETKILPYREEGSPELLQNHSINFGSIDDVVHNSEIIFVPIQTPHDYKYEGCTRIPEERDDFNYSFIKSGIKSLSDSIKKQSENKVVVVISTVLPGTIQREIMPIIQENSKFKLCYNPFFIAMGTTLNDFMNPEFVLFGVDDEWASQKAEELYKTLHNRPFYKTKIVNAELIKVCYNTFIGMKIVFANTVMEICHKTDADVDSVMGGIKLATERLISTKYLNGGMGDGGGCHPRDNIAMSWLAEKLNLSHNFFEDIMAAREDQTEFLANLMLEYPGPYYILGKTFKEETNLILGSPAILLNNILKEKGIDVVQWDPWIDSLKYEEIGFQKGVYFIASKHEAFKTFDFPAGSIVIDVWRYLNIKNSSLTYIPVGGK
jgi:UDPglucose 6-dehydrogenase